MRNHIKLILIRSYTIGKNKLSRVCFSKHMILYDGRLKANILILFISYNKFIS